MVCATGPTDRWNPLGPFTVDCEGTKNLVAAAQRAVRCFGPMPLHFCSEWLQQQRRAASRSSRARCTSRRLRWPGARGIQRALPARLDAPRSGALPEAMHLPPCHPLPAPQGVTKFVLVTSIGVDDPLFPLNLYWGVLLWKKQARGCGGVKGGEGCGQR